MIQYKYLHIIKKGVQYGCDRQGYIKRIKRKYGI